VCVFACVFVCFCFSVCVCVSQISTVILSEVLQAQPSDPVKFVAGRIITPTPLCSAAPFPLHPPPTFLSLFLSSPNPLPLHFLPSSLFPFSRSRECANTPECVYYYKCKNFQECNKFLGHKYVCKFHFLNLTNTPKPHTYANIHTLSHTHKHTHEYKHPLVIPLTHG
jgi:hypothetical protein